MNMLKALRGDRRTTKSAAKPAAQAGRLSAAAAVEGLESRTLFDATLGSATNIGPVEGTRTFNDSVSVNFDRSDFRRFTLTAPGQLNATLTPLNSDVDLSLYNSSGGLIASASAGGTAVDTIVRTLPAGTYFVEARAFTGASNYRLALTTDYATPTRNLGTLFNTRTFRDFVGSADTQDRYQFVPQNSGTLRVTLGGLTADADVELLNSSGVRIASSTAGGSATDSFSAQVVAGQTYTVRVYQFSGNTNYALTLAPPVDTAGNTLASARNLGFSPNTSIREFIGNADRDDFYRFTANAGDNISLLLSGLSSDLDLRLLNSSGGVIATSAAGGTANDSINRTATYSGTYYVRVFQFSGNTNYNLALFA